MTILLQTHQAATVAALTPQSASSLTNSIAPSDVTLMARFSPSGQYIITVSNERTAHVWHAELNWPGRSLPSIATLPHPKRVFQGAVSDDALHVVTSCADGFVRIWKRDSASTYGIISQLRGSSSCYLARACTISPKGDYVVATFFAKNMCPDTNGTEASVVKYESYIIVHNVQSNQIVFNRHEPGRADTLIISRDAGVFAVGVSGRYPAPHIAVGNETTLYSFSGRILKKISIMPQVRFSIVHDIWDLADTGERLAILDRTRKAISIYESDSERNWETRRVVLSSPDIVGYLNIRFTDRGKYVVAIAKKLGCKARSFVMYCVQTQTRLFEIPDVLRNSCVLHIEPLIRLYKLDSVHYNEVRIIQTSAHNVVMSTIRQAVEQPTLRQSHHGNRNGEHGASSHSIASNHSDSSGRDPDSDPSQAKYRNHSDYQCNYSVFPSYGAGNQQIVPCRQRQPVLTSATRSEGLRPLDHPEGICSNISQQIRAEVGMGYTSVGGRNLIPRSKCVPQAATDSLVQVPANLRLDEKESTCFGKTPIVKSGALVQEHASHAASEKQNTAPSPVLAPIVQPSTDVSKVAHADGNGANTETEGSHEDVIPAAAVTCSKRTIVGILRKPRSSDVQLQSSSLNPKLPAQSSTIGQFDGIEYRAHHVATHKLPATGILNSPRGERSSKQLDTLASKSHQQQSGIECVIGSTDTPKVTLQVEVDLDRSEPEASDGEKAVGKSVRLMKASKILVDDASSRSRTTGQAQDDSFVDQECREENFGSQQVSSQNFPDVEATDNVSTAQKSKISDIPTVHVKEEAVLELVEPLSPCLKPNQARAPSSTEEETGDSRELSAVQKNEKDEPVIPSSLGTRAQVLFSTTANNFTAEGQRFLTTANAYQQIWDFLGGSRVWIGSRPVASMIYEMVGASNICTANTFVEAACKIFALVKNVQRQQLKLAFEKAAMPDGDALILFSARDTIQEELFRKGIQFNPEWTDEEIETILENASSGMIVEKEAFLQAAERILDGKPGGSVLYPT